jgi:hypothetical protein
MPKTKKTDLQVLRALLSLPADKLSTSERSAFQAMYDQVASGHVLSLSFKQRAWADAVYDKHNLDNERPPAKLILIRDKSLLSPIEKKPLPLKPPGRK